jgi:hypothetical protein
MKKTNKKSMKKEDGRSPVEKPTCRAANEKSIDKLMESPKS